MYSAGRWREIRSVCCCIWTRLVRQSIYRSKERRDRKSKNERKRERERERERERSQTENEIDVPIGNNLCVTSFYVSRIQDQAVTRVDGNVFGKKTGCDNSAIGRIE